MAKRCLEHFSLESTQYDFMTFSDLSFLVDNPYYGTNVGSQDGKVSSYGTNICQVHSSDSEYMHNMDDTSAIFQKELSTSYSGYTNFNLWINNTDTIVISNGMLTSEVSSRDVRWAIILDDSEKLGWVVSRHVDGNCYVCGGDNDTGGLIYYAFAYGVISISGGAGSGYIGNSLVSNKKMVGYNVPISSSESTKTESVNEASESPVSGKPKIGNGFARIKLIEEFPQELVLYNNGNVLNDCIDIDNPNVSETSEVAYYQKSNNYLELYSKTVSAGNRMLIVKFPLTNCSTYTKVRVDFELYIKQTGAYTSASVMIGESDTEELAGKEFCNENYSVYKYGHWCLGDPDSYHSAIDDSDDNMSFTNQNEDLSEYLYIRIRATNERSENTMRIKKIILSR